MSDPNTESPDSYEELRCAAERLLSSRFRATLAVDSVQRMSEPGRRNLLLRCRLSQGPTEAPATVVLKRARQHRYDPDDVRSRSAVGLLRDWAGLEFLNGLGGEFLAVPRFYGGDRRAGFFLMEDLGGHQDLDHVLTCGSAFQARQALCRLAETLGRMHARTIGHGGQYQQIRDALEHGRLVGDSGGTR